MKINWYFAVIFRSVALMVSCLYIGCAHQKSQLSVTQYNFNYENKPYRIRSILSTEKSQSLNELIGDSVVAADYDQDRIIDRILYGNYSLDETQQIYEHGLNGVSKQNKLIIRKPLIDRYIQKKDKKMSGCECLKG